MNKIWWMILLGACTSGGTDITGKGDGADDTDTTGETEDTTPAETDDSEAPSSSAIVGDWVSQGDDVAELLAGPPGNTVRIDATFSADGSYEAVAESQDGSTFTFVGEYTVDDSTDPSTIEIAQSAPYPATVQGIWAVEGGVLTYDIVDVAFGTPPTVAGGFGSSSAGAANIQTYRKP
jgi:hypothetical protein